MEYKQWPGGTRGLLYKQVSTTSRYHSVSTRTQHGEQGQAGLQPPPPPVPGHGQSRHQHLPPPDPRPVSAGGRRADLLLAAVEPPPLGLLSLRDGVGDGAGLSGQDFYRHCQYLQTFLLELKLGIPLKVLYSVSYTSHRNIPGNTNSIQTSSPHTPEAGLQLLPQEVVQQLLQAEAGAPPERLAEVWGELREEWGLSVWWNKTLAPGEAPLHRHLHSVRGAEPGRRFERFVWNSWIKFDEGRSGREKWIWRRIITWERPPVPLLWPTPGGSLTSSQTIENLYRFLRQSGAALTIEVNDRSASFQDKKIQELESLYTSRNNSWLLML